MIKESTYYSLLPFIILYFFLNNVFLPHGLLYTTILTPLFLYWLYRENKLRKVFKWFLLLLIPVPFHFITNPDLQTYLVSSLLLISAWVFLFTSLEAVKTLGSRLEDIFFNILIINSILLLIALIILPFSPIRDIMWSSIPISNNIPPFPRLKLLAYEPSHYALLLSPVFLFFLLKLFLGQSKHPLIYLAGIGVPMLLSVSFGVLGGLAIAMFIVSVIYFKKLPNTIKSSLFYGLAAILFIILIFSIIWPSNPVYLRMENIFTGVDTSAKGRLIHSFMFAKDIVWTQKAWFGIGPGQVKVIAHDMIVNYYKYTGHYAEIVRIPNSMAEMLATYGWYGFILKIAVEIYFFIRLKIYNNLYSLSLFIFVFIYQFTGSFIVNVAELGIWAIVYRSKFSRFHIKNINQPS